MSNISEDQRKINISEFPKELPDFTASYEPKESLIKKWIINWIKSSVSKNTIKENDILPKKSEISEYLGVSVGTVQNAIRYIEDEGLLKSKQKLGTMISNSTNPIEASAKSTSKRDQAITAIKQMILNQNIKVGKTVMPAKKMAEKLNLSQNTVRLAYEYLTASNILESKKVRGKEANWILRKIPEVENIQLDENISAITLVDKLTEDLKHFLADNYVIGDKIPSHEDLAKTFNVSAKTIHDCVKNLCDDGILLSKRGRYGTIISRNPLEQPTNFRQEDLIFASAEEATFYSYQKTENEIINLINSNYKPGDKLPSMQELSKKFNVSTNTVRRALNNLSEQGYITFGRGRFGGTFLVDEIEEMEKESYQWLSINPNFIK